MDQFINFGKQMLQEQIQGGGQQQHHHQQQQYQQGGRHDEYEQRLPPGDKAHGGAYPAGGNFSHNDDFSNVHEEANRYAGSSSQGSDFFSGIVDKITQNKSNLADEDIDEEDAVRKHQQVYGSDSHQHADESSMGKAAAIQALKRFVGGNSGQQHQPPQNQGGFLAVAMAEASQLFDQKSQQGRVPSGASKQNVVQQAGEMAVKLYMKN